MLCATASGIFGMDCVVVVEDDVVPGVTSKPPVPMADVPVYAGILDYRFGILDNIF
jgi:hypothetical protein